MANTTDVRIVVNAIDKATGQLSNVDRAIQKLGLSAKDTKDFLAGAGVNMSLLESPAMLAGKAVGFLWGEFKKSIQETINYADTVRTVSAAIGTIPEEASRVIQVFDDWGISADRVQTSLAIAAKNGFEPTIENLAKLADETNAIASPTERADKLAKIFGRSWQDVSVILDAGSQAIRDHSEAIQDSLILNQEAIDQTFKLQQEIDNLSDSYKGAETAVGMFFIPTINQAIEAMRYYKEAMVEVGDEWDIWRVLTAGLSVQFKAFSLSFKNQYKDINEAATNDAYANWIKRWQSEMAAANGTLHEFNPVMDTANRYMHEGAQRNKEYAEAAAKSAEAAAVLADENSKLLLDGGLDGTLAQAWADVNKAVDEGTMSQQEAEAAIKATIQQLIYEKAAAKLDADASLELARAMGLVDEQSYNIASATIKITDAYNSGQGDIDSYSAAMQYLADAASDGNLYLSEVNKAIDILNGKEVTATINIVTNGYVPDVYDYVPGTDYSTIDTGDKVLDAEGYQGWVTKPTMHIFGEAGPEYVSITPERDMRTMTNNFYNTINTGAGGAGLFSYFQLQKAAAGRR